MNKKESLIIFFLLSIFLFTKNSLANNRNLNILAEPQISKALTKIVRLYSQQSNTVVSINFNSSSSLFNEIESGEPSDIFISAHPKYIELLKQKGLVDVYNIEYLASDKIVLTTASDNKNITRNFLIKKLSLAEILSIINAQKANLLIENQNFSSGDRIKSVLTNYNFPDLKIFNKIDEDRFSIIKDIKEDISNYAFISLSQIKNRNDLKIINMKEDLLMHYQAFIIAGNNMDIAREFLKFLKSNKAKKIFLDSGFSLN